MKKEPKLLNQLIEELNELNNFKEHYYKKYFNFVMFFQKYFEITCWVDKNALTDETIYRVTIMKRNEFSLAFQVTKDDYDFIKEYCKYYGG